MTKHSNWVGFRKKRCCIYGCKKRVRYFGDDLGLCKKCRRIDKEDTVKEDGIKFNGKKLTLKNGKRVIFYKEK